MTLRETVRDCSDHCIQVWNLSFHGDCKRFGVYLSRPAVNFRISAVYQLRPGLLGILVAYRGQFSGITVVYHAVGSLQTVKVDKVICSERRKDLVKFPIPKTSC